MLHLPSYEFGKVLARYDIARDNVAANKYVFMAALDAALNPDGDATAEYRLAGMQMQGTDPDMPMWPLSIVEGYFWQVIHHNHAQAGKARAALKEMQR